MKFSKADDKEEMDPFLPSGAWDGFYCYRENPNQHQMEITLSFKNGVVAGSGVDDVASFTWKGAYDLKTYKVYMTKFYKTHKVYYKGDIDENGIWGTWKLNTSNQSFPEDINPFFVQAYNYLCNGGFHIWPSKQGRDEIAQEASNQVESKKLKELYLEIFS